MRTFQAIVGGLALGLVALAEAGCSGLGSSYEPGIANPGYTPGHGPTRYASSLAAAPTDNRLNAGIANGAPAPASVRDSASG
jgi:hypothetical protein